MLLERFLQNFPAKGFQLCEIYELSCMQSSFNIHACFGGFVFVFFISGICEHHVQTLILQFLL